MLPRCAAIFRQDIASLGLDPAALRRNKRDCLYLAIGAVLLVPRGFEHARRFTWRENGRLHLEAWRDAA